MAELLKLALPGGRKSGAEFSTELVVWEGKAVGRGSFSFLNKRLTRPLASEAFKLEAFLDELSRRIHDLTREEMAAIVRRAVPRVVVKPRADGRKVVAATYCFGPPVTIETVPLPRPL